jgi:hypothetical protein
MQLIEELYRKISAYLAKESSLDDFRCWFVLKTWDAQHQSDDLLASLVREIDIRLIEVSNGDLPESELRNKLISLASTRVIRTGNVTSGSSSSIINQPPVVVRPVDIRPVVASA